MYEYCMSPLLPILRKQRHSFIPRNEDERIQYYIHIFTNDIEYFVLTYIFVNLITPYQNEHGLYVKDFLAIVLNYMFSWDGMWLDLVASVPGLIPYTTEEIVLVTRSIRLVRFTLRISNKLI